MATVLNSLSLVDAFMRVPYLTCVTTIKGVRVGRKMGAREHNDYPLT